MDSTDTGRFERRLTVAALAYALCHHVGSLPGGLGEVGPTRWADWLDLATPYLVLLPAAAALAAARPTARQWAAFAVGAVTYAEGHGIHLSSNSIGNVAPGDAVHLWDEVVGHLVWYSGVAIVIAALATAARDRPRPAGPRLAAGCLLALAVGGTWATNAFGGGGTSAPALLAALALTAYSWRHRTTLPALFLAAALPSAAAITLHLIL